MITIDIVITIFLAIFFILGFRKGIISEIFTFLGFFIAIIGAMSLTHYLIQKLHIAPGTGIVPYVAYFIVFIAIFIIVSMAGRLIEKIIKVVQLNLFNRIGGGILGLFKVIFLVSLIFWLSSQVKFIPSTKLEQSVYYKPFRQIAPKTIAFTTNHLYIAKNLIGNIEHFFNSKMKENQE